jgi:hypothetical protein
VIITKVKKKNSQKYIRVLFLTGIGLKFKLKEVIFVTLKPHSLRVRILALTPKCHFIFQSPGIIYILSDLRPIVGLKFSRWVFVSVRFCSLKGGRFDTVSNILKLCEKILGSNV